VVITSAAKSEDRRFESRVIGFTYVVFFRCHAVVSKFKSYVIVGIRVTLMN
jgi:hypothetical protein